MAVCLVLYGASSAAVRGRTWGVALAAAIGVTFLTIWTLGIAPGAFALVGFLALRPFLRMFRHFLAFDRSAAMALAAGAATLGGAAGVAWKAWAHHLFAAVPALLPALHPHHAALAAAAGAAGVAGTLYRHRSLFVRDTSSSVAARVRIGEEHASATTAAVEGEEDEALAELEDEPRRSPNVLRG